MAKRNLIKTAAEFNLGLHTIVEFLEDSGFDIDSKPNAKVSDEMYDALLKEYRHSRSDKVAADNLVIGTRPTTKPDPEPAPAPKPEPKVVSEPIKAKPTPPPAPPTPKPEPVMESTAVDKPSEISNRPKVTGPKVLGKVDLEPKKKTPTKPEPTKAPEPVVNKTEKVEAPPKVETPIEKPIAKEEVPPKKDKATPKVGGAASDSGGEDLIRAKTPQLKGLKILGKIDASKLESSRTKKKDDKKPKPKRQRITVKKDRPKTGPGSGGGGRRPQGGGGGRSDRRGKTGGKGKKDQTKEVSAKEIEEKLKATMARINTGGKSKRQKIRRDNRQDKRERQEMVAEANETDVLQVTEFITVSDLASLLNTSASDIITKCFGIGVMVSINQRLDAEIIELIASEFDREVEFISAEEELDLNVEEEADDPADLVPRPPVVTVMGHVDHGKTSLLDYVRKARVAEGEAGGITQHVGAYEVKMDDGRSITFLDTPGHEAFTAMRARGAKVTDIVIIVVAADDKIMPQTKEAISHAQAAGVPMIFAINKIDKDGANPEKIKEALAQMNILVEDWGGEYQSQDISAKKGTNIDELLEKVLLQADLLELKANPNREATGTVLEASLEKGRGYVTKMLIQNGTLHIGDSMLGGMFTGRVKAMFNELGKKVKAVGPGRPVLVLGLDGAPQAGETMKVMEESDARQIATKRSQIHREQSNRAQKRISLDEIGRRLALGDFKELNLIVKGDVDGSVEALSDSLIKLSIEKVQVNVIHRAVGQIIESDVLLASASDAIIIGFQVRPSQGARITAEKEGVEIKTYSIIYEAIEELKAAIEGLLEPTKKEEYLGTAEIRETFKISKLGTIAGAYVLDGKIVRSSFCRLIREGIVIYPTKEGQTAKLGSLKRFKEDVKEVKSNMECGFTIEGYNDIKVGDTVEFYEVVEIKQTYNG